MINYLWGGMILVSIVVAGASGNIEVVTSSVFDAAERAITVTISLLSIMAFWLGMMRIIEDSGFIDLVKSILKPLAFFLFPGIPREHPAMNSILMNMSANLLGMGNAATPFGIKAMEQMQKLNSSSDTASNEMCTFLALNTSSLTIFPTTIIALRAATGSLGPTEIIGTTLVATFASTVIALLVDKIQQKRGGLG